MPLAFLQTARARLVALGVLIALLAAAEAIRRSVAYETVRRQTIEEEDHQTRVEVSRAGRCIDAVLGRIAGLSERVAAELAAGPFDPTVFEQRLKQAVEAQAPELLADIECVGGGGDGSLLTTDRVLHSMGFAVDPAWLAELDPQARAAGSVDCAPPRDARFAIMYTRPSAGTAGGYRPVCYDYTAIDPAVNHDWYRPTVARGSLWHEPHYGRSTGAWVANFTTVMRSGPDGPVRGVLFSQIALDSYARLLSLLDFGPSGYGFLVSAEGKFIAHPSDTLAVRDETIWSVDEPLLRQLAGPRPDDGRLDCAHHDDFVSQKVDGQTFRAALRPIERSGWCLGAVLLTQDMHRRGAVAERRGRLAVAFWWMLAATGLLMAFAVRKWPWQRVRDEVIVVCGVSLVLLAGGVYVLQQELRGSPLRLPDEPASASEADKPLMDAAGVGAVPTQAEEEVPLLTESAAEAHFGPATRARSQPRARIPTGVFVQSLNFTDTNDVAVTGYVWQRFRAALGPDGPPAAECPQTGPDGACIRTGFVFPEAIAFESREAYRRTRDVPAAHGKTRITEIGWYFETTLRQPFYYEQYPFDGKDVWLRLWPAGFADNVVLMPDLASYEYTAPALMPGLDEELLVPGWNIQASFFSYRSRNYDTRFGVGATVAQPELFFHVLLRRNFTNALITNFGPLLVVVLMLFGLVLSISRSEDREGFMAFNFNGFLGTSASLFFVVIVAHIQLREKLDSQLVYLEYFFVIMYAVLFVCSALAYVVALDEQALAEKLEQRLAGGHPTVGTRLVRWLNSRRGYRAFKLLYWPTLMSTWFVLTVKAFY